MRSSKVLFSLTVISLLILPFYPQTPAIAASSDSDPLDEVVQLGHEFEDGLMQAVNMIELHRKSYAADGPLITWHDLSVLNGQEVPLYESIGATPSRSRATKAPSYDKQRAAGESAAGRKAAAEQRAAEKKAADEKRAAEKKAAAAKKAAARKATVEARSRRNLDEGVRGLSAAETPGIDLVHAKRIQASVDTTITYDDNIYLEKDRPTDDLIISVSPSISSYYGNSQYLLSLFYNGDAIIHTDKNEESRYNQSFGGRADLFRQSRVKVSVSDTLSPTTDAATAEITDFVKRLHNSFMAIATYDMSPKTSLALQYDNTLQHYESSSHKNYRHVQHVISPRASWHVTPKTSLTAEYNLGLTEYYDSKNFDSIYHQARAGIEGQLTPKSKINLKAGYQYRTYDNNRIRDAQAFVLESALNYIFSPKTSFDLLVSHDINESTLANEGFYRSLNAYVSCTHRPWEKVGLTLSSFYLRSDYPEKVADPFKRFNEKRNDDVFGGSIDISYDFAEWLSAHTMYEYKKRHSTIRSVEYDNNRISAGMSLTF